MLKKLLYTILFVAIFPFHNFGQNQTLKLKGKVLDENTNSPLIGVNIFISNSFLGTSSDLEGKFEIKNYPEGITKVVFSMVGYEKAVQEVNSAYFNFEKPLKIKLTPKSYELDQINIVTDKSDWNDLYDKFCTEFIGTREFGNDCKILNPFAINFNYDKQKDRLTAHCDSILIVENMALGYKIELLLDSFVWDFDGSTIEQRSYSIEPRFIELVPEDDSQLEEWKGNRYNTYRLSTRYFYYNLINRTVHHDDYIINTCKRNVSSIWINSKYYYISTLNIIHDKLNHFYEVPCENCISVIQMDGAQEYHSYIEAMFDNLRINENYRDISLSPVTYTGYWSTFRVSDLLPDEYKPKEKN